MDKNLAYIDPVKCRLCRKCVPECPTDAILEINFPPPRVKEEVAAADDSKATAGAEKAATANAASPGKDKEEGKGKGEASSVKSEDKNEDNTQTT